MRISDYQSADKIAMATTTVAMGFAVGEMAMLLAGATPLIAGMIGMGLAVIVVPLAFQWLDRLAAKIVAAEGRATPRTYVSAKPQAAIEQPRPRIEYQSPRYLDIMASERPHDSGCRLH